MPIYSDQYFPAGGEAGAGGGILQVTYTIKTDTWARNSSAFGDITGLYTCITPRHSNNKILVIAKCSCGAGGGGIDNKIRLQYSLSGSRYGIGNDQFVRQGGSQENYEWTMIHMHHPNTTSQLCYYVQGMASSNEIFINRDGSNELLGDSVIMAMEVSS